MFNMYFFYVKYCYLPVKQTETLHDLWKPSPKL